MSERDDDFRARPGRVGNRGGARVGRARSLAGDVRRAAMKAGFTRRPRGPAKGKGGPGRMARGGRAALALSKRRHPRNRRVVVKARTVQHRGARFRAAPLAKHIAYLERDGVARDGGKGVMFDANGEIADTDGFAERCKDDRHHFRFIVSPEDAADMADIRSFARELVADMERDLETKLDWVAIDHWNTDHPHVHILVRGVADDGRDLVIDRDYISSGMRDRAEERVTIELGRRTEQDIVRALGREVNADRWTSLDEKLRRTAYENGGVIDLRPGADKRSEHRHLLIGRVEKLESLGVAQRIAPACWTLKRDAETVLRDLGLRGDIIKTMHRAMAAAGRSPDPARFALHGEEIADPILGRLVDRGLHDELSGDAYAVVEGVDGRVHHLQFEDLDLTSDARPGAIVELRAWTDAKGNARRALAVRSDLPLGEQVRAQGATWLDRQLVAKGEPALAGAFGEEVRGALDARVDHLAREGLARRDSRGFVLARNLITTLRNRELEEAASAICERTGLEHRPGTPGDAVSGAYRERITLASGRFAMIDDGLGFQLVPWRPALDSHLGRQVSGVVNAGGGIDWALGRARGVGI